nr:HIT domain-containing protein [bacterium]
MSKSLSTCIFCSMPQDRIVTENDLAYVVRDGYPVTELHTLIIPKRHAVDYFDLAEEEVMAIHTLLHTEKQALLVADPSIQGFNIGANCGQTAGQTVFHCHIHLIPRRMGDVAEPRGGVRHLIPGKGS